jgi:hypothetical protein
MPLLEDVNRRYASINPSAPFKCLIHFINPRISYSRGFVQQRLKVHLCRGLQLVPADSLEGCEG